MQTEFRFNRKRRDPICKRFAKYHRDHPDVFDIFMRVCHKLIRGRGKTVGSADYILHVVRWHYDTSVKMLKDGSWNNGFKICNDFSSRYARLACALEPDLDKFFEFRSLTAKFDYALFAELCAETRGRGWSQ